MLLNKSEADGLINFMHQIYLRIRFLFALPYSGARSGWGVDLWSQQLDANWLIALSSTIVGKLLKRTKQFRILFILCYWTLTLMGEKVAHQNHSYKPNRRNTKKTYYLFVATITTYISNKKVWIEAYNSLKPSLLFYLDYTFKISGNTWRPWN